MLDDIGHGRALSGLHVVDCFNRCVIPAPVDVKYVALSYLWGTNKSSHPRESDGKLPADVPSTIQDAITVTLNLGLQYLWVDAYCILQTDHDDVHRQIRQMDLIYRSAQVTIIAVESSTGLPGVSRPRRQWQFEGNYNTTRFQTFLLGPKKPIQSSRWWSRGWTFQEGFFSRRRLFFMEDQLILDC
ncbi:HET-domain-containing protein, partial [Polyplosphaeria fusca]